VVAHFNHNLRGAESEKDSESVVSLTSKFGFELALEKGDISLSGNLEQNARRARYAFLRQTAENVRARAVLTAHTLNDQAETLLMNLMRGSGLRGLSGMKTIRALESEKEKLVLRAKLVTRENGEPETVNEQSKVFLIRPLLNWARRLDTENYCRENRIEYRNDAMNEDLTYNRVRVRKILLPMLADFNPNIIETLAETAKILRQEDEFLESRLQVFLIENKDLFDDENRSLAVKTLRELPAAMLNRVIRRWLESHRSDLRRLHLKHIEAIARLAFSSKSGNCVELPNGEKVVKKDGKLSFKNFEVVN
jgi:tRNA(Ile)-lysidine synthase